MQSNENFSIFAPIELIDLYIKQPACCAASTRAISSSWLCSTRLIIFVWFCFFLKICLDLRWEWNERKTEKKYGINECELVLRRWKVCNQKYRYHLLQRDCRQCSLGGHGILLIDCKCIPSKFCLIRALDVADSIDRRNYCAPDVRHPCDSWWTYGSFLKDS